MSADHGTVVVRVRGEIDISTGRNLAAAIDGALVEPVERLTIDLTETTFIDAAGVTILVRTARRLGSETAVVVRTSRPMTRRVLELCGAGAVLEIEGGD